MTIRVGDVGRAATELAPGGAVELEGVRYPGRSDGDDAVPAGTEVEVVRAAPTCLVVRPVGAGLPLADHGQSLGRLGFDTNRGAVARAEKQEERDKRAELVRGMWIGAAMALLVGAAAGATSAGLGWQYDWGGVTATHALVPLLGLSAAVGAAWAVVLFFFSGWFTARVLPAEEGVRFEPSFLAVVVGLVGAALGFWLNFGADSATVLVGAAALSLAFTALTAGVMWVLDVL